MRKVHHLRPLFVEMQADGSQIFVMFKRESTAQSLYDETEG